MDTTLDFLSNHVDAVVAVTMILVAIAGAYWTGAKRAISFVQHNEILQFALEHAYDAVNHYTAKHGKDSLPGGDKARRGIELAHKIYQKLRVAPPADLKNLGLDYFTRRHDQESAGDPPRARV